MEKKEKKIKKLGIFFQPVVKSVRKVFRPTRCRSIEIVVSFDNLPGSVFKGILEKMILSVRKLCRERRFDRKIRTLLSKELE
ncbi:hypothetical protein ACJIZ3_019830 [Penstemon smallii]|uniref:Uncharacterized protein n=1 Tax=Penstemon smallii TaxID=265156 RepID=A0ABD3T3I8_9LAMI